MTCDYLYDFVVIDVDLKFEMLIVGTQIVTSTLRELTSTLSYLVAYIKSLLFQSPTPWLLDQM